MALLQVDTVLEEGSFSDDATEVELLRESSQSQERNWAKLGLRGFIAVTGAIAMGALLLAGNKAHISKVNTDEEVTLFAPLAATELVSEGVAVVEHIPILATEVKKYQNSLREEELNYVPLDVEKFKHLTFEQEVPRESRHDGNLCADDEEELMGLCYSKCSSLTSGTYPFRTTAFSCCRAKPCSFFNSKFSNPMGYCKGFDVSGKQEGRVCPHAPGTCLVNEELKMGVCYERCAILTDNVYPHRSGPSTCCKYESHLACIDPRNAKTSRAFDVGGGAEDTRITSLEEPHLPMPEFTEA